MPQGQISTTAPGLVGCAASQTALKNCGTRSAASSGEAWRVRLVEAGRRGIEMLAVDLQSVEAPFAERLAHECGGIFLHRPVGRAQVQ